MNYVDNGIASNHVRVIIYFVADAKKYPAAIQTNDKKGNTNEVFVNRRLHP